MNDEQGLGAALLRHYLEEAKRRNQEMAQVAPRSTPLEMDLAGPSPLYIKGTISGYDEIQEKNYRDRIRRTDPFRSL
jgi:hypothetical protein